MHVKLEVDNGFVTEPTTDGATRLQNSDKPQSSAVFQSWYGDLVA